MTTLTKVKLGLTIIGLILFAYGARVDDATIRLIAIGFVAAASLLRFVRPRGEDRRAPTSPDGGHDGDGPTG